MSGTETNNKKITLIHKLAYGSGNMLGSGALAISGAWLLYFYTTFCNMSVVKATLIFSIATYLDVILNPLMGFITDSFYRTKLGRKFGRRRFFTYRYSAYASLSNALGKEYEFLLLSYNLYSF